MAKKRGKDKPPKRKQSRKEVEKALSGPVRRKPAGPRSQALPGMGRVRDVKLDNLCESIGEARDKMNTAKVDERSDVQAALKRMQSRNLNVYRHSKVELSRVPGGEKLRVRVVKEESDASVQGGAEAHDTGNDEMGGAEVGESNEAVNE